MTYSNTINHTVPKKPTIIFKDMPIDWKLISGDWNHKTDIICINTKFGKFIQRSTYFHEMLHRKIHKNKIFSKEEVFAGIFEEGYCGLGGLFLAIIHWNYEVKLE